jgi:DNA-binding LytR/AlgR family response regulator
MRIIGDTYADVPLLQGALGIAYSRLIPNALAYGVLATPWRRMIPHAEPNANFTTAPVSAPAIRQIATGPASFSRHLVARGHDGVKRLSLSEIDWIEAADYYARIHTGRRATLIRESMASLERRLDPGQFCRVHRSAIVRLDRVRELRTPGTGGCTVVLVDGRRIPVNRSRLTRVKDALAPLPPAAARHPADGASDPVSLS